MKKSTFRRQVVLVVWMLLCGLFAQAADEDLITQQITINALEAGTLPQRISSSKKNLITNLKIIGEINGTDLKFIREMAGRDVKDHSTDGKLSILDLYDAKIVSGGDCYYIDDYTNNYYTQDNIIGEHAFWCCDRLTSITLPSSVKWINHGAFVNSMAMLSKEYERSTEDFIEHFKRTYTEPFPPAWILGELLPMGSVNMYYRNLKDKGLKKQIAKRFCLHAPVFESWLSVLTLTRNACCHHARVWNKVNKIIPNDMRGMTRPWITIPADKRRIYYNMCIIKYFLDIISPNNDMLDKMHNLFSKFPEIDLAALGFPVGWEQEPLWIQANN